MRRHHLAGLLLVVAALAVGCTDEVDVFELEVGDCFDQIEPGDGTVESVTAVDCDQPHDHEVYATYDLDDGDWPGADAVRAEAEEGCRVRFEVYVGAPYADSELEAAAFWPTEASWQEHGDREVVCFLSDPDDSLTGSMRDTER